MPDAIYTDPRLAELYDSLNPYGPDTDFYCGLTDRPGRILDLGCGTGLLATLMASRGHAVIGIDPASAMLEIARRRPGGDEVRWVEGDIAALPPGERFDLALMTGHVFQVFLDNAQALSILSAIRSHLVDGGRLAFESRNPDAQVWTGWTPERTKRVIRHPRLGPVETFHRLLSVEQSYVTFETQTRFVVTGETHIAESTLVFRSCAEIEALLRTAGFVDIVCLGDWNDNLFQPSSSEIIVVAA